MLFRVIDASITAASSLPLFDLKRVSATYISISIPKAVMAPPPYIVSQLIKLDELIERPVAPEMNSAPE